MRLVSLCPSNTELLAYLHATEFLVGVDDYSDWPESIKMLPKLGPDLDIDIQKVKALKPDLVLASLSVPGMEKNIEGLKAAGLPYVIFNPSSLEDIIQDVCHLGQLINMEDEAKQLAQKMRTRLDQYHKHYGSVVINTTVYWEWWPKPVFTPGKTNWLTEMSELLGVKNCFGDEPVASVQTSWDEVVRRNPDHICLVWVGVNPDKVKIDFILNRDNVASMTAFQKEHIYVLKEPYFCRPSPRLFVGLQQLEAILYPHKAAQNSLNDDVLLL